MAVLHEPGESLKEKALKALEANHDTPSAPPKGANAATYGDEVEQRMRAIRMVRDLEPKRACQADMVRSLTRQLMDTPGDSIHYSDMLEKLRQAHDDWLHLEQKLWAANYIIRSTQWLVDLLADPGTEAAKEAGSSLS